jgi:hypothetical protein
MMRIIKTLAENDGQPPKSTTFSTMHGILTHKPMSDAEEQISIHVRKPMERIKSITVYGNWNARREGQVFIEHMPVGIAV